MESLSVPPAAEAQFRRLAESSLQAILVHDGNRRLFANAAYAELYGYPSVDAVLEAGETGQHIFPEDMEALRALWREILAGRQSWSRQRCRRRRLDGSLRWIDLVLGPIVWEGELVLQGIQVDVTREVEAIEELAHSEARYRRLAEESLQGLVIHDGRRRLFVNPMFVRMMGYPDVETAIADDLWSHVPPDQREATRIESEQSLAGGQSWTRRRVPRQRVDGSPIWLDLVRGPILWEDRPAVQVSFVDVTAQVEAETALRRSEHRLRAVIDHLPHVLTVKDSDRRLQLVNRAFETWYDVSAADVIGKTTDELPTAMPLDPAEGLTDDLIVLATGRPVTRERRRIRPNGESWDSIRTKFAVPGPDGAIEGIGTIMADVTTLKSAQLQLESRRAALQRNQEALLRILHDELSGDTPAARIRRTIGIAAETLGVDTASVWRVEEENGVLRCLERWQRHERPDRRFPTTLPLEPVRPVCQALDDHLVVALDAEHEDPEIRAIFDRFYAGNDVTATLCALIRLPDGGRVHVGFSQCDTPHVWQDEDETFARSIAELVRTSLLQDAVEQREQALRGSEARLRAIIDNLPHVLTLKDTNRRFLMVNRAFEEWYGVPAETAIGRTPEELSGIPVLSPLSGPEVRADEAEVIVTGGVTRRETQRPTAAGASRDIITTKFPLHDISGKVAGVGTVVNDVTALKRAQAQLVQREIELTRNQTLLLQALRDEQSGGALPERIERAVRLIGETLGVHAVAVWRRSADGAALCCVARWCAPDSPHGVAEFPASMPLEDLSGLHREIRERLVVAVEDTHAESSIAEFARKHYASVDVRATLSALIRMPDGEEALLGLGQCGAARRWSGEDEAIVHSLAELIRVWFLQDALESRQKALQRNQAAVLRALREELSGGSLDERVRRIIALAGETLEVDGAALWRVDTDARVVRCAGRWRTGHLTLNVDDFPATITLASAQPFYEQLERHMVLALDDHRADPRLAAFLDENWTRVNVSSSLAALIHRPDGLADYVVFSHYGAKRRWSVEDQSFVRSIAELIGVCQFQAAFEGREQALRRNQETLLRIAREGLLGGGTTQEMLDTIVRIAGSTLGLTRVAVWTCGEPLTQSDRLCAAIWEPGRPQVPPPDQAKITAASLRSWFTDDYHALLRRDFLVAIEDVETDPHLTAAGRAFCRANGTGARLNAVVQLPERVSGVVTFLSGPGPRRWSAEDRAFARSVADLVAFVMLSERHRQALAALDLVSQGLYVADGRGDVIYANRVARRLAGVDDAARVELSALPALPAHGDGELMWQRHDDEAPLELVVTRTPLPSTGAVTVIADVTELKQRERERRALEAEMRQAAKLEAVGRLAGGIAHDFNNLLGTVVGFAGFLAEDLPRDSQQHGYARRIVQASEHAKEVVKQLLAFTRTSDIERRVLDLRKLVHDSSELLRASLPSSTRLVIDAGRRGLPALVNSTQIHQVLLNLCINANDALGGEPGIVTVTLTHTTAGTDAPAAHRPGAAIATAAGGRLRPGHSYARLTVTDDGLGMDAATVARVFDPFFTTKGPGRGTGLGLAVVHGIVAGCEGAYLVESELGGGSSFSVFLPLADALSLAVEARCATEATRGGESILVVDDERDLLDMMCMGLERLGYRATGCADPLQALEAFRAEPERWAAVVTDEVMPGLKGSVLVARLREISPGCPIVLCTGFSDGTTERQAREAGAAGFFLKPVEPVRIAQTIRALIDRPAPDPRRSRRWSKPAAPAAS